MPIAAARKAEIIREYATNAGDNGSPEVQVALLTARVNQLQEHLRVHDHVVPLPKDAHLAIGEHGQSHRVRPHADALETPNFRLQALRDVDSARAGVACLNGTEELVGLQHELAAQRR